MLLCKDKDIQGIHRDIDTKIVIIQETLYQQYEQHLRHLNLHLYPTAETDKSTATTSTVPTQTFREKNQ